MKLPSEAEKLLLPPAPVGKFVPDQYDIEMADLVVPWREAARADIGLVGIPFDTAVVIRRGCRFGPDGIRAALAMSTSYEPGLDVDLSTKSVVITDFGNVDAMQTDVLETHRRVEVVLTEIRRAGVTPLVLGGDHSLAYPNIKSLINVTGGPIGVINIDAHLDLRISHHGEISSGTPFRRLLELPGQPLHPRNFVEIGINGWHNSAFYMGYAREKGIRVIPAREVHQRGIEAIVKEALDRATSGGVKALYLSFDIDGLDMAAAPGTCAPNAGGLTAYQGLEAVWLIGQHPLCQGFDVMEVAPPLDILGLTSTMGAALAMHFIGARARARSAT